MPSRAGGRGGRRAKASPIGGPHPGGVPVSHERLSWQPECLRAEIRKRAMEAVRARNSHRGGHMDGEALMSPRRRVRVVFRPPPQGLRGHLAIHPFMQRPDAER